MNLLHLPGIYESEKVEPCVFREMEGTEITRKILRLDETRLVLETSSAKTKKHTVLTWKKKIAL